MEVIPSGPYRNLLTYLGACSAAAIGAVKSIRSLPPSSCSSAVCKVRYPENINDTVPGWMQSLLPTMENALRDKPCSSTLAAVDAPVSQFFLLEIGKELKCMESCPCSHRERIAWGTVFLAKWATAVDKEVAKVSEIRCGHTSLFKRLTSRSRLKRDDHIEAGVRPGSVAR